jgi:mono/diheme cytochrome c family protein
MSPGRAVLLVGILCATAALAQNPSYRSDPNWWPPIAAIARQNPLASKPEAAAGGRKLFLRHCVECHGGDGAGLEKKHSADFQLAAVQDQSDGALFWRITNGNATKGMPSFSSVPELQRWQIVLFIRTLKPAHPPTDSATSK